MIAGARLRPLSIADGSEETRSGRSGSGGDGGLLPAGFLRGSARRPPSPTVDASGNTPVVEVTGSRSYAPQVQETATREPGPVLDVPQGITVINRQLLDDIGARRTDDAMLFVPGVQLFSGYGGTWDDYTIRGVHVWSASTYRNGFLNGYSGANAVDAVNVERIEVLRGPASALYGPGLPGGSVNFITKLPLREPHLRAGVSVGSFDTFRTELDATGPVTSDVRYRLTGSAETTSGYRDFNDFRRWLVNPVVVDEIAPGTSLLFDVQAYQVRYRADPSGVPSLDGDPFGLPVSRSFSEPALPLALVEGGLARVEMTHALGPRWSLRVSAEDKIGHYSEETLVTTLAGPLSTAGAGGLTIPRAAINWASSSADTALQVALHGDVETGPIAHELIFGADLGRESVTYRASGPNPAAPIDALAPRYGEPLPPVPLPGGGPNSWSYRLAGAYASDMVTVHPQVRVLLGARADTYDQESFAPPVADRWGEVVVSPRAAVLFLPTRETSLYANVNEGFWPSLGVTADGHVLKPEHGLTYEVGGRVALAGDRLTFDAGVFDLVNRDLPVIDPANPNFQKNLGEATSRGVELAMTATFFRRLRAFASYTYLDAFVSGDPNPAKIGAPLPFSAHHTGAVWLHGSLRPAPQDGPSLGIGGVGTSERSLLDGTTVPGYVRLDAVAAYRLGVVSASLRVENVLGVRYVRGGNDVNSILPGAPRSYILTISANFR